LDGSPALYYLRPGAEQSKYLLFHEGGGECDSVADCSARATTPLGSSATYPHTAPLPHIYGVVEPFFDTNAAINPLFHNWTHVYVRYCDGSWYASDRIATVIGTNNSQLHFRGRYITQALVADLHSHHGLGAATDIVIGGCSAGGAHVVAHLDRVRALLPSSARVVGYVDSGFVMDSPRRRAGPFRFLVSPTGHNGTWLLSQRCLAEQQDPVLCLTPKALGHYTSTPLFLFQSTYDLANLRDPDVVDPSCESSPACVNSVGANMSRVIHDTLLSTQAGSHQHAAFLDSCARHCQFGIHPVWMPPTVDEDTPMQAVAKWYAGLDLRQDTTSPRRRLWAQGKLFPCYSCCNRTSPRLAPP
jgi:hypothetical protein